MLRRILIVEDDIFIAFHLEDIVESAGHRVVGVAANMAQALKIAESVEVDIAIMDIRLAGESDGLETAKQLYLRHRVPALYVSASINDQVRATALSWQPIGFVNKPFEAHEILQALASA